MQDSIGSPAAGNPSKKAISPKPEKPYPEFPLYAHATRRWAKKVKGRTVFFGPWDDWKAAYDRYTHEIPYLLRGEDPPPMDGEEIGLTVGKLVNLMLDQKMQLVESDELSLRTWNDYKATGERLIDIVGRHRAVSSLTSQNFAILRAKLSASLGLVALGNEIGRVRVYLNWAYQEGYIDKPVRMGQAFKKPSRKALRAESASKPKKIFTVVELAKIYSAAGEQMKCFILLGLNGGLGNADIGQLEPKHLAAGWIIFPRPKTQIDRRFPLWPETIEAIESTKQTDPEFAYLFKTKYGGQWHKEGSRTNPLSAEFRKLCESIGLYQEGRGFYSLRHQFRTIADAVRDRVAIDHIMGHADDSMGANYTEWIDDARLRAVTDHVRSWCAPLFASSPTGAAEAVAS